MIHRCICVVIVWLEQSCWDVAAELVLVNLRTDLIEFAFTYASAHQHSARRSVQKQQHWVGRLMSLYFMAGKGRQCFHKCWRAWARVWRP